MVIIAIKVLKYLVITTAIMASVIKMVNFFVNDRDHSCLDCDEKLNIEFYIWTKYDFNFIWKLERMISLVLAQNWVIRSLVHPKL